MISVSSIKSGSVVSFDKEFFKVTEAVTHSGGGKAGSMVHFKLRNLSTGHVSERRFNPDDKIEEIDVSRVKMQLLYREGDAFHFMNPETYEQIHIAKNVVGPAAVFLKENDEYELEFYEEKPLSLLYPPVVELRVASAGAGLKGEATFKEASLENGLTVLVPHFIKENDLVRIDVETGKYLDRVSEREVKGAKFSVAAPEAKAPAKPETKK